ncbi:unnamed protein product [Ectocarpus fasciculatus]
MSYVCLFVLFASPNCFVHQASSRTCICSSPEISANICFQTNIGSEFIRTDCVNRQTNRDVSRVCACGYFFYLSSRNSMVLMNPGVLRACSHLCSLERGNIML